MKDREKRIVAIGLVIGVLLAALESTIVATAMPKVIHDLGGDHLYSLPFSVYLLASTVSSPIWGRVSDLFGRKVIYVIGILLFLFGSAMSGFSDSMIMLVFMRVIQGLGAGCVTPLTFTINGEMFSVKKRAKVQAYMSAVWGLAGLLGPLIGGLIVDHMSWRYVFFLNIPFGLIALFLVYANYAESDRIEKTKFRLDWPGAILFTTGTSMLVWGLEQFNIILVVAGPILILISWFYERNHDHALLPVRSMKKLIPRISMLLNLLAGMAYFGILAYLPLYVQDVANRGATAAGLVLTPMIVGWTISNVISGRLISIVKLRHQIQFGFSLIVIGFGGFVYFYDFPLYYLSGSGFIIGLGMGFSMLGTLLSIQEAADKKELGSSTSGLMFARSIGGSIGVAILSLVIGDALNSEMIPVMQAGFREAYIACLLIAIIGFIVTYYFSVQLRKRKLRDI